LDAAASAAGLPHQPWRAPHLMLLTCAAPGQAKHLLPAVLLAQRISAKTRTAPAQHRQQEETKNYKQKRDVQDAKQINSIAQRALGGRASFPMDPRFIFPSKNPNPR